MVPVVLDDDEEEDEEDEDEEDQESTCPIWCAVHPTPNLSVRSVFASNKRP